MHAGKEKQYAFKDLAEEMGYKHKKDIFTSNDGKKIKID